MNGITVTDFLQKGSTVNSVMQVSEEEHEASDQEQMT
jgi:hypothetical protein